MSSAAIATIVKMVESLPDDLQERVAEHLREYIADLEDDVRWESSFRQTHENLDNAARQVKREIAEGKSISMDEAASYVLNKNTELYRRLS
jgi:translation initiation factor 2B subunit (eIF-2B alpha/beta/delta family)